jgi:hypothetical protein
VPRSAAATAGLLPVIDAAWRGAPGAAVLLILSPLIGVFVLGLCAVVGAAGHYAALAIYLGGTARARRTGHPSKGFLSSAWEGCGFGMSALGAVFLIPPAYVALVAAYWFVLVPVCQVVGDLSHLPFHPGVNTLIVAALLTVVAVIVWRGPRAVLAACAAPWGLLVSWWREPGLTQSLRELRPRDVLDFLREPAVGCLRFALIWVGAIAVVIGGPALLYYLFGVYLLQGVVVAVLLVLLLLLFLQLHRLLRQLVLSGFLGGRLFRPGLLTAEAWQRLFETADPEMQASYLSRTDHQALGLTPEQFLDVLKAIRARITAEPALSVYWDLRDQLEQTLRQERRG